MSRLFLSQVNTKKSWPLISTISFTSPMVATRKKKYWKPRDTCCTLLASIYRILIPWTFCEESARQMITTFIREQLQSISLRSVLLMIGSWNSHRVLSLQRECIFLEEWWIAVPGYYLHHCLLTLDTKLGTLFRLYASGNSSCRSSHARLSRTERYHAWCIL